MTGTLVVVSAPSGAGKTTLIAAARARRPDWLLSVSFTTRAPRAGEHDGVDYHFVSPQEFARLEAEGEFLEAADVHGSRYGTPRAPVEQAVADGHTLLLEIDVKGARAVRAAFPEAVMIFVAPPSWEVLEARLTGRGTEGAQAVRARLANAKAEMAAAGEFEHRIINDDLDDAVSQLIGIIEGPSGLSAGTPPNHTKN